MKKLTQTLSKLVQFKRNSTENPPARLQNKPKDQGYRSVEPTFATSMQTRYFTNKATGYAEAMVAEKTPQGWQVALYGLKAEPNTDKLKQKRYGERFFTQFEAAFQALHAQEKIWLETHEPNQDIVAPELVEARHFNTLIAAENIVASDAGELAYLQANGIADRPGSYELSRAQIRGGFPVTVTALQLNQQQADLPQSLSPDQEQTSQFLADLRADLLRDNDYAEKPMMLHGFMRQVHASLKSNFQAGNKVPVGQITSNSNFTDVPLDQKPTAKTDLWQGLFKHHAVMQSHEFGSSHVRDDEKSQITYLASRLHQDFGMTDAQAYAGLERLLNSPTDPKNMFLFGILLSALPDLPIRTEAQLKTTQYYIDEALIQILEDPNLITGIVRYFEDRNVFLADYVIDEPDTLFNAHPQFSTEIFAQMTRLNKTSDYVERLQIRLSPPNAVETPDGKAVAPAIKAMVQQLVKDPNLPLQGLIDTLTKHDLFHVAPKDIVALIKGGSTNGAAGLRQSRIADERLAKMAKSLIKIDIADWPILSIHAYDQLPIETTQKLYQYATNNVRKQLVTDFVPPFADANTIEPFANIVASLDQSPQEWHSYLTLAAARQLDLVPIVNKAHKLGNIALLAAAEQLPEGYKLSPTLQQLKSQSLPQKGFQTLLEKDEDWDLAQTFWGVKSITNSLEDYTKKQDVSLMSLILSKPNLQNFLNKANYQLPLDQHENPIYKLLLENESQDEKALIAQAAKFVQLSPENALKPVNGMSMSAFANLHNLPLLTEQLTIWEKDDSPKHSPNVITAKL